MKSIKLENARFFGYHGYYEEEAILGNEFSIDIWVDMAENSLVENDQLSQTINYESLYTCCKEVMMGQRKKLLESLAREIGERIRSLHSNTITIRISVAKINPPLGGRVENSSVEYLWKK